MIRDHGPSGARRAALHTLVATGLVTMALAMPTPMTATEPAASAGPAQDGGTMLLHGPTGVRAGVPLDAGSTPTDLTGIAPFDTYGRDPGLTLEVADGDQGFVAWSVTAVPVTEPAATPTILVSGTVEIPVESAAIPAPDAGEWLVSARILGAPGSPSGTWAWHLVVPDRALPESLPAPDIVLFGGGATVVAERGSGCYLGQCGDIGREPPAKMLPRITLQRPDEPIALTLSDGSGLVALHVQATPLGADATDAVMLVDGDLAAASGVVLVPPPPAGEWRLSIDLRFSDGRGDQAGYARVTVP